MSSFPPVDGRPAGLTQAEVENRLRLDGPNELVRRGGSTLPQRVLEQLVNPLALLLWVAALLSWATGSRTLAIVIVAVILLNAVFALVQERQAERAVEALREYLPVTATVVRDGTRQSVAAADLVLGDRVVIDEGDRISADARLVAGTVEVDMSTLTGESMPVERAARTDARGRGVRSPPRTSCSAARPARAARRRRWCSRRDADPARSGRAPDRGRALGAQPARASGQPCRVADRGRRLRSRLAFLPIGVAAGLDTTEAPIFAIGLLVANVPEGLLPTITLALAAGVRELARRGALVKRLSAVETLGSTNVICTDKTGTLTRNRMRIASSGRPRAPSMSTRRRPAGTEYHRPARADARRPLGARTRSYVRRAKRPAMPPKWRCCWAPPGSACRWTPTRNANRGGCSTSTPRPAAMSTADRPPTA